MSFVNKVFSLPPVEERKDITPFMRRISLPVNVKMDNLYVYHKVYKLALIINVVGALLCLAYWTIVVPSENLNQDFFNSYVTIIARWSFIIIPYYLIVFFRSVDFRNTNLLPGNVNMGHFQRKRNRFELISGYLTVLVGALTFTYWGHFLIGELLGRYDTSGSIVFLTIFIAIYIVGTVAFITLSFFSLVALLWLIMGCDKKLEEERRR